MKEAYVRPSAQLFAEMYDIWEKRLDDFEKFATVDPLHLTESVEVKLIHQMLEFTTTQAPPSKEIELKCLERFEYILTGKRSPKRFNDTHKKFQLALNVYLGTTYYKEEKTRTKIMLLSKQIYKEKMILFYSSYIFWTRKTTSSFIKCFENVINYFSIILRLSAKNAGKDGDKK